MRGVLTASALAGGASAATGRQGRTWGRGRRTAWGSGAPALLRPQLGPPTRQPLRIQHTCECACDLHAWHTADARRVARECDTHRLSTTAQCTAWQNGHYPWIPSGCWIREVDCPRSCSILSSGERSRSACMLLDVAHPSTAWQTMMLMILDWPVNQHPA